MKRRALMMFLVVAAVLLVAAVGLAAGAAYNGYPIVRVLVNGTELVSDVPAIVFDGRTMLPVRAVAEAVGLQVHWDETTKTALLTGGASARLNEPAYLSVKSIEELNDYIASADRSWALRHDGVLIDGQGTVTLIMMADIRQLLDGTMTATQVAQRARYLSTSASTPSGGTAFTPPLPASGAIRVYAQDTNKTYLGDFSSSAVNTNSICNRVGIYGSSVSIVSIWNSVGQYGSTIGIYSAFNDLAINPPQIVQNGKIIGYLTTNTLKPGAVPPHGLCERLNDAGM